MNDETLSLPHSQLLDWELMVGKSFGEMRIIVCRVWNDISEEKILDSLDTTILLLLLCPL